MRTFFKCLVFILSSVSCLADYYQSSTYYCPDLKPQQLVDIAQLEGIWYLIEKIIHHEERHFIVNSTSCPVIHISEDLTRSTTQNPLYKSYGTTYGSGYPHRDPLGRSGYDQQENVRSTTYNYQRRKDSGYIKQLHQMHYLRMFWDENSYSTEYQLRYDNSRPGFWISSEPADGTSVPENIKHFTGTIQVIKAVGNHLVLTFCHAQPENRRFTLILSRENHLESRDIHSVHAILIYRGLSTNAIEKSCNKAPRMGLNAILSVFSLVVFLVCCRN